MVEKNFVTLGDMKNYPREELEEDYQNLYFTYLLNERDGHMETANRQRRILAAMKRVWGFSEAEVLAMEAHMAWRLTETDAYIEQVLKEHPIVPPTRH